MNLKYILVITLLCLVNTLSFSQKRTVFHSEEANKKVRHANYLIEDKQGNKTFIQFDKNTRLSQISNYKNSFHLQEKSNIKLKKEYEDALGIKHIKYMQTYDGIRIVGGEIILHCRGDIVTKANGKLFNKISVDTKPKISQKEALDIALQSIHAKVYKWQVKQEELLLQKITKDKKATYYPKGELIITSKKFNTESPYQLAYLFDVQTVEPLGRIRIEIDAHTGEIINQFDQIHHTKVDGSGESLYNDEVNIKLDYDGTNYNLSDVTRGNGIFTYDLNNGTSYGSAKMISESDSFINNIENHAGVSAHFGAAATYDYYYNNFGRNSFDDEGSAIKSYVHYSNNYFNAFWNGLVMTYGDGNGVTTFPLVTLDIVGHEITHAVTQYSADLVYAYESGALNESFSDIFGQSIEFATAPETASWNLGDQVYADGISMIRSMSNPKSQGDPSTYKGQYWVNGNAVHTNSGVMNYWYYLLVEGGTGTNDNGYEYEVNGIGINDAQQIAYRNLTVYLTENSQYMDARVGAEEAAIDLFGENSTQHLAVVDAWNAVGVPTADPLLIVDNELDFGDVPIGLTQDLKLIIANQGNALLNVSSITVDNPDFSLSVNSLNVEASKAATITVSFTPPGEGSYTGDINIKSNGGEEIVNLTAVGVTPPVIAVNPQSFSESLFTGESTTQSLTIDNSNGGSDLNLSIHVVNDSSKVGLVKSIKQYGDLGGQNFQSESTQIASVSPSFTGDHLSFNISEYGEIMPYQFPIGTEQLRYGDYISGYTIAYEIDGIDKIAVAGYESRISIIPISYSETVNDEKQLIVEVVTQTTDGFLEITRKFIHDKSSSHIKVNTTLLNKSDKVISNVVLKSFADWDIEGDYNDDNWDVDPESGLAYAFNSTYHSIGSDQIPDFQDIDGWGDYDRRNTDENVFGKVSNFDGLQVLHFELGNLAEGVTKDVTTAYMSANSLDDLLDIYLNNVFNDWLSVEESMITIPSGTSKEIPVTFDASELNGGTYTSSLALESNDPSNPLIAIPVTLNVTGAPDIEVSPINIDFGEHFIGAVSEDSVLISNKGTDTLSITNITVSDSDFSIEEEFPIKLTPSEEVHIKVHYTPTKADSLIATLTIHSNDTDEGSLLVNLAGKGVTPPVIAVNPESFSESLFTGESTTQSLTIDNSNGGSDLNLSIHVVNDSSKVGLVKSIKQYGDLGGQNFQSESTQIASVSPSFTGDHLSFNISEYGEIMPYQFPIGTEQLRYGDYISGYTIAYEIDGIDKIAVAGYESRISIIPISYSETVNDEKQLIVEVVTQTTDGFLEITRKFIHDKSSSHIKVNTTLLNKSDKVISNVVLKSFADWDIEGDYNDDNWDVDPESGLAYAFNSTYHSIGSDQIPDFQDIDGWGDYDRRNTDENVFGKVSNFDGLQVLHFELGNLAEGVTKDVTTAYMSANSLDDLLDIYLNNVFNDWLSVEESMITIPSGTNKEIPVTFDATRLKGGTYKASLALESNDPINPLITLPVSLNVTEKGPNIELSSLNIDFGAHFRGTVTKDSILVSNNGTDTLSISNITVSDFGFAIEEDFPIQLPPGEATNLIISYYATKLGVINAMLTIESNDKDEKTELVELTITIDEAITPETPTGLSALPVSQTQIDLLWNIVADAEAYEILSAESEIEPFTILATIHAPNTAFSHSGLSPNQTVFYQVRSKLANKVSPVNTINATTFEKTIPLVAPSEFSAIPFSETQIDLLWDTVTNAEAYEVLSADSEMGPFAILATINAPNTAFSHSGLSPDQTVFYQVRAKLEDKISPVNTTSATTFRKTITLAAPNELTAVPVSQTQIDLLWNAVADAEAYEVLSADSEIGPFAILATIHAPNTVFSHSGLSPNLTVYYQVRAKLANDVSPVNVTTATTLALDELDVPTGFAVTALTKTENQITWSAPLKNVDEYILERAETEAGPFTVIAELEAGTTTFDDAGLTIGQIYFYRLKAKLGSQESDYTPVLSFITSIQGLTNNVLMIYPNPTNTGKIILDFGNTVLNNAKITLYNSTGNKVLAKSFKRVNGSFSIDLGKTSTGIFLLELIADEFSANRKVVIR